MIQIRLIVCCIIFISPYAYAQSSSDQIWEGTSEQNISASAGHQKVSGSL